MVVVGVTLLAALLTQLGFLIWKTSADSLPAIGEEPGLAVLKAFLLNVKWWLGMLSAAGGWLLLIKATDLGEISIVQPLMSIGDLMLVVVAVVYLHERLNRVEWIGLGLTLIGATVLATQANLIDPTGILWTKLAVFLVVVIFGFAALALNRIRSRKSELILAVMVGLSFGTGAVLTELFTASISLQGDELESTAFFLNPILPAVIGVNALGIGLLQAAFQRGRAAVVVPVSLSVTNGLVVIGGIIIFSEPVSLVRVMGIGLIIAGTGMLNRLSQDSTRHAPTRTTPKRRKIGPS